MISKETWGNCGPALLMIADCDRGGSQFEVLRPVVSAAYVLGTELAVFRSLQIAAQISRVQQVSHH
jgi:hypothetical protein